MLGTIERIKNNVLQKCSVLNDETLNVKLVKVIDKSIYYFAEELYSLISNVYITTEESLRDNVSSIIKKPILKKVRRKLFIDSLALQITNDSYIEDYVNNNISIDKIKDKYIKELKRNKNSNQLNMTEDLDITEIFNRLLNYLNDNVISKVKEDTLLVNAINSLSINYKKELEEKLNEINNNLDNSYLSILVNELVEILNEEAVNLENEGEDNMMDAINEVTLNNKTEEISKFDKYDDMTLFNKTILSLNTKEEKLTRQENKLSQRKEEIDQKLAETNKNIETNVERENALSQRKLELNNREIELSSKLSEVEVILLNMKPLINGLSKLNNSNVSGGDRNE